MKSFGSENLSLTIFWIKFRYLRSENQANKYDRTKTVYRLDWNNTHYNLITVDISPKPDDMKPSFTKDTLKFEIYHIEQDTYYYQVKVKGTSWFSKAIKLPENIEYANYHTGWTQEERDKFMKDCINHKKIKALSKAEADVACSCVRSKIEKTYPLYAMLPKDLDKKLVDMIISCLYRK